MPLLTSREYRVFLACAAGFGVVTLAVAAGWTAALDHSIDVLVARGRGPLLSYIAVNVTALGSEPVAVITLIMAAAYLGLTGHGARSLWIACPALGVLLTSLPMKDLIHHQRPTDAIIALPASCTYPSGHAATAVAVWVTLALAATRAETRPPVRRVVLGAALVIALLVAWSRVYLGVHYFSDVVGGMLLGTALVFLCAPIGGGSRPATPAA